MDNGIFEGFVVGRRVGFNVVGTVLGVVVVGRALGERVEMIVGESDLAKVGEMEGIDVCFVEGRTLGTPEGKKVLGFAVGSLVVKKVGRFEGFKVGLFVGKMEEIRAAALMEAVLKAGVVVRCEVHITLEGLH